MPRIKVEFELGKRSIIWAFAIFLGLGLSVYFLTRLNRYPTEAKAIDACQKWVNEGGFVLSDQQSAEPGMVTFAKPNAVAIKSWNESLAGGSFNYGAIERLRACGGGDDERYYGIQYNFELNKKVLYDHALKSSNIAAYFYYKK
jgi:hypothetical protein